MSGSKYLIIYGTKEGQTAKIADKIGSLIREKGYDADVYDARKIPKNLSIEPYNGVIVGSSLHYLRWSHAAADFVIGQQPRITTAQSAFFSVSMMASAPDDPKVAEGLKKASNKFFDATKWHPATVEHFAGGLAWSKYGFFTRYLMKGISYAQHKPVDSSKDQEFTNWDQVGTFTENFVERTRSEASKS